MLGCAAYGSQQVGRVSHNSEHSLDCNHYKYAWDNMLGEMVLAT